MAQTMVVPKGFNRVERLSSYNHNVYFNGTIYIREQCDDDTTFSAFEEGADCENHLYIKVYQREVK